MWAAALLIAMHVAGLVGLTWPISQPYFLKLVPFHLLFTTAIVIAFHTTINTLFIRFAVCTFVAGFLAEVLGVKTGLIFGYYSYGSTLGWKLWTVPIIIGCNWLILVYCSGSIARKLTKNRMFQPILAATLMVLLDLFIEPVAIRLDFWQWESVGVPLQNYIGWFLLSFLLQLLFQKWIRDTHSRMAVLVYGVQFAFFLSGSILFRFF